MATITQNMSLNLKIDSKGCTFLLRALIWHLKAYAFVMERLSRLRLRERMHIQVTVGEVEKCGGLPETNQDYIEMPPAKSPRKDEKLIEVPFQKVSVKPGDVIVLSTDRSLSELARINLRRSMEQVFTDNRVSVLDEGFKLGVMAKGGETT